MDEILKTLHEYKKGKELLRDQKSRKEEKIENYNRERSEIYRELKNRGINDMQSLENEIKRLEEEKDKRLRVAFECLSQLRKLINNERI